MDEHGVPDLQVAYFPGIDLYTHVAEPPLTELLEYFEEILDPIGRLIERYREEGLLDETYFVFVSDHGHTPVRNDPAHALGS
jgi:predicted AlkP superfamily pyrophosphatase or phosphodiesterase